TVRERVALAPYTTLGVGGPARWFVEATDEATLLQAVGWARAPGGAPRHLGGGSKNRGAGKGLGAARGQDRPRGRAPRGAPGGAVEVTAAAGEPWDDLVALAVGHGWAGLECLSGIPGLVGATPMQNVGAYGQEVSETVIAVRALDTRSGQAVTLSAAQCGFAY